MMLLRGRWVERRRQARIRFDAMQCNASDGEAMGWARNWGGGGAVLLAQGWAGQDVRAARQRQVPPYVLPRYVELRGAD